MASLVTDHMESYGTKFLKRCFPTKVEKLESNRLQVTWKNTDLGTEETDSFDTVMWAVGKLDYQHLFSMLSIPKMKSPHHVVWSQTAPPPTFSH